MHEEIQEITDSVNALLLLTARYARGAIIPWSEIEMLAGNRFENRGRHIINKWRRRLEKEQEIVTLVATTIGVRLLTHRETANEIPNIGQRKAYRTIRRSLRKISTVDIERLSDHERRSLAMQRANMAATRRALYQSRKQQRMHVTEGNPRRRAPG